MLRLKSEAAHGAVAEEMSVDAAHGAVTEEISVNAAHGAVTDSEEEMSVDAAHDLEKEMLGKTKLHNIRFSNVLRLLQDNIPAGSSLTLITPFAGEPLPSIDLSGQGKLELSLRLAELLIAHIRENQRTEGFPINRQLSVG